MKHQLTKQVAYEHWANTILINTIKQISDPPARALELLGHVVAVHHIWRSRISGEPSRYGMWDVKDLDTMAVLSQENAHHWAGYIEHLDYEGFSRTVPFQLLGSPAEVTVEDALSHMFTHSAYHRGQVILLLKGLVEPLPLTTYIAYAAHHNS